MASAIRWTLGIGLLVLVVTAPLIYSSIRSKHYKNFKIVHAGVLYRSGQLTQKGLQNLMRDHGIRTVITLRDAEIPGGQPPDAEEEEFCRKSDIAYYRISPRNWWAPDGSVPAQQGVNLFFHVMDDPRTYPVLIHCYRGVHRTGAFCAIYRMEYQGWSNEAAVKELHSGGYTELEDEWDLLEYLEEYRPRALGGQPSGYRNRHGSEVRPVPKDW